MTKPDRNSCQLCRKATPKWWCIDRTPQYHARITSDGQIFECQAGSMYPVCQRCREQTERDMRRGRKVEWIEWSDHVEA